MYLRHTVVRKGGRAHTYWRLVRSVRRGRKVVQETAAHLGELDGEGRVRARLLAQAITGRGDQGELFEEAPAAEQAVAVRLDRVRIERARAFGDVWLGWTLWQALRLDELCTALLPRGREVIPWAQMAAVLVIARLCEPSSELHIAEDWYRTTALEDNLLFFRVLRGKRTILDTVRGVQTATRTWHTLKVTLHGRALSVSLDGEERLKRESEAPPSGRCGLWSKADSQVLFDDFTVGRAP